MGVLIRHEVINTYDIVSSIWKHIENNWKRIIRKINDRIRLSFRISNVKYVLISVPMCSDAH